MGRARDIANIINSGTFITPASASATYLPLTGGSLSGNLSVNGTLTNSGRIGFKAYLGSNTSVASDNKVPFNTTYYNYGNYFNTTTSTFSVPITGFYMSNVQIRIEDGTNQFILAALSNQSQVLNQLFALNNGNSNGFSSGAGSTVHYLTQGDVVHMIYSWATGGTKTLISQNQWVLTFLG
jgi:hypothetical protein